MSSGDGGEDALREWLVAVDIRQPETYDVIVPIKPPLWLDRGLALGLVHRDLQNVNRLDRVEALVKALVEVVVRPQRDDAVPVVRERAANL